MRDHATGGRITSINKAADSDEDTGNHLGDFEDRYVHGAVERREGGREGGREEGREGEIER